MRRILVGMTGGIAAYKVAELVRLMQKQDFEIDLVMTAAAEQFITPLTLQALIGKPVYTDLWQSQKDGMPHIHLSRDKDAILIAPASADFIAKIALGLADDLLSAVCVARQCKLIVVPAMNASMWENAATQRNIAQLKKDGVVIIGPTNGDQACGESGMGRMLEPEEILNALESSFHPPILVGKKILITTGPTYEPIDAARGITNRSSGKMGFALAQAALDAGARVCIISGPTQLPPPALAETICVTTTREMLEAVQEKIAQHDIFISVAAVADYYVLNPSEQKIKKDAHILTLELAPNVDILATIAQRADAPFCVGFAAESENLYEYAERKRRNKKLPLLIGNRIQDSVGSDDNEVVLFDDNGTLPLPKMSKSQLAHTLIREITERYLRWNKH